MKQCSKCKEEKPKEQFYKSKATKDGHCYFCKKCMHSRAMEWSKSEKGKRYLKHKKRKERYNLSQLEFTNLLLKQANKCAICTNEFESTKKTHVDHNHLSGVVRGLLCDKCNRGLGYFKDNVFKLQSAINYLQKGK